MLSNAPTNVKIMIFVLMIYCIIICANFILRKSLSDSSGHPSHRSCFDDFWKTPVLNQKFCSIKSSKMLVRGVDDVSISPQIENLSSWWCAFPTNIRSTGSADSKWRNIHLHIFSIQAGCHFVVLLYLISDILDTQLEICGQIPKISWCLKSH